MNLPDPKAAGKSVATRVSGSASSTLFSRTDVYSWAGLGPDDVTETDEFRFWSMAFVTAMQDTLLESDGRWLKTARGEGFRLLSPDDSVEVIAADAERLARRKIAHGKRRIRLLRAESLSADARVMRTRAEVRLGMLAKALRDE